MGVGSLWEVLLMISMLVFGVWTCRPLFVSLARPTVGAALKHKGAVQPVMSLLLAVVD